MNIEIKEIIISFLNLDLKEIIIELIIIGLIISALKGPSIYNLFININ